jgi:hypothetical protein
MAKRISVKEDRRRRKAKSRAELQLGVMMVLARAAANPQLDAFQVSERLVDVFLGPGT